MHFNVVSVLQFLILGLFAVLTLYPVIVEEVRTEAQLSPLWLYTQHIKSTKEKEGIDHCLLLERFSLKFKKIYMSVLIHRSHGSIQLLNWRSLWRRVRHALERVWLAADNANQIVWTTVQPLGPPIPYSQSTSHRTLWGIKCQSNDFSKSTKHV